MDKKGLSWQQLGGILIALVALVLLGGMTINWYNAQTSGDYDPISCRASVELKAKTKDPIFGSDSPFNLKCTTKKEISETLVEREILKDIAMDMYDCWWQFGEGEIDFLSDIDWFGSDFKCYPCAIRRFSENGFRGTISINKLEAFLDSEKIPSGRMTFSEFFTKVDNGRLEFGGGDISIGPETNFYVFFMANKKSEFWNDIAGEGKEEAATAAVGTAGIYLGKKIGTRVGSKFIPGVGWVLLGYDVFAIGGVAEGFHPALVINSGVDETRKFMQERCDGFG